MTATHYSALHPAHPAQTTLVLGVGNAYRSDDGVGLEVVRALKAVLPATIPVREESGEGAALMEAWQGARTVILCDAVHSGAPAGTIHRLLAHEQPIPRAFFHYSTHAFSVAEAIEMARALAELPPEMILYGIEGADFAAGVGLSPPVAAAASAVVPAILADLRHCGALAKE